jgi:hypothetical protein
MITEAVVRFQSETITETFPAKGPTKAKIIGKETPQKKEIAERVQDDMNYELTEVMKEFRPEHERMLFSLPAIGSAFKKVYKDPTLDRQTSVYVSAEDIILPYGTTELQTCPRLTHRMRKTENDILKLQKAGFYRDLDLGEPPKVTNETQQKKDKESGMSASFDDRYELYEVHIDLDLPGCPKFRTGIDVIGLIAWNGWTFCNAENALSVNFDVAAVASFCFGNDVAAVRSRWGKGRSNSCGKPSTRTRSSQSRFCTTSRAT